jgi:hypothetical protein
MTQEEARLEIGRTARAIRDGVISYIEGAREITSLGPAAGLERDPDVTLFIGISSESDALPIGAV